MANNDQNTSIEKVIDDDDYFVDFSDLTYDEFEKLSYHKNDVDIHNVRYL